MRGWMGFCSFTSYPMRFESFTIKNFKGIKEISFKLDKSVKAYTLVGLNESGKTSILEAINAFRNIVKSDNRHTLIPKSEKLNFNGAIEISATISVSSQDKKEIEDFVIKRGYSKIKIGDTITVKRKYEFNNSNSTKSTNLWTLNLDAKKKGSKKFESLFKENSILWNEVTTLVEKQYFPSIIYYPNFLFDFPDKIYLENGSDSNPYYSVIQEILYSIDKKLTITDHLLARLKSPSPSNNEALELTLSRMSTKVSQVVFKAWEKLFKSGKKEIVIRSGSELVNGLTLYFLQFKLKEGSDQFFIAERSLGFKWFFSFLLFTEFRKKSNHR